MNLKPRNFDEVIENVLVDKGVCTSDILNKYSKKEKSYYFNQFLIGATNRRKHPKMSTLSYFIPLRDENIYRELRDLMT